MDAPQPADCPVCRHPSRAAIEVALDNRKPHRQVARDFHIGDYRLVAHHAREHPWTLTAPDPRPAGVPPTPMERMQYLESRVDWVLDVAEHGFPMKHPETGQQLLDPFTGEVVRSDPDPKLMLAAVREARRNVVVIAELVVDDTAPDADVQRRVEAMEDPATRALLADLDERLARGRQQLEQP